MPGEPGLWISGARLCHRLRKPRSCAAVPVMFVPVFLRLSFRFQLLLLLLLLLFYILFPSLVCRLLRPPLGGSRIGVGNDRARKRQTKKDRQSMSCKALQKLTIKQAPGILQRERSRGRPSVRLDCVPCFSPELVEGPAFVRHAIAGMCAAPTRQSRWRDGTGIAQHSAPDLSGVLGTVEEETESLQGRHSFDGNSWHARRLSGSYQQEQKPAAR